MSDLDLAEVEERFAASRDLTVGIEEEFAILDPDTLELTPRYEQLAAAGAREELLRESITGELISSEIEIISGPGRDIWDALERQRERRRRLFALAGEEGVLLGATGTHPWADYRKQSVIDTDHYRRVAGDLRYVAARNNTFSLHVHVGIRGVDRAVQVCDRMRGVLPLLLAVSANSPFLDGRDSGLHSARTQAFTRNFPRCGIPDAFGSWRDYREYVELLVATGSIVEFTQLWWSVRPHFRFGTVEIRICDAQSSAEEADGLASLIVACVAQAARDLDEAVPCQELPNRLLEENMWRAIRFGQEGRLIDFARGEEFPASETADRLREWTAPVRAELDLEIDLPARNGAQRQRELIDRGDSMEEIYAETVRETMRSYAQEVKG